MPVHRVVLVVLDGVGAGALPDADAYGDAGSSTLAHTAAAVGGLRMPALQRLGLGCILPVAGVPPAERPVGCYGRLREMSPGKDSVTGHWEMMGVVLDRPFPTYPRGFPRDVMAAFEAAIGCETLGNEPASGTEIIHRLGVEHLRTGRPIVYTSADSVFQIAAHERRISVPRLYGMCEAARQLLRGEHAVGRVIARPFEGEPGAFRRTERRRDYPLDPPHNTLDDLAAAGRGVHAIGKIREFFNGRGIATWDGTTSNAAHAAALREAIAARTQSALIFANLEDFDMLYGHRNDPRGFADALEAFDAELPAALHALAPADLLVVTSDHGNDPTTPSTDHSREHALLLTYGPALAGGVSLGDRATLADISATIREALRLPRGAHGTSFLPALGPR